MPVLRTHVSLQAARQQAKGRWARVHQPGILRLRDMGRGPGGKGGGELVVEPAARHSAPSRPRGMQARRPGHPASPGAGRAPVQLVQAGPAGGSGRCGCQRPGPGPGVLRPPQCVCHPHRPGELPRRGAAGTRRRGGLIQPRTRKDVTGGPMAPEWQASQEAHFARCKQPKLGCRGGSALGSRTPRVLPMRQLTLETWTWAYELFYTVIEHSVMVSARGCPGSTCISPVWLERCKLWALPGRGAGEPSAWMCRACCGWLVICSARQCTCGAWHAPRSGVVTTNSLGGACEGVEPESRVLGATYCRERETERESMTPIQPH